jgi:acetolactate synthase-1/2/3 large subunit
MHVVAHAKIHSHWVRVTESAEELSSAGAEAVAAAKSGWGKIATLIVPANHAWEPSSKSYDKVEFDHPNIVPKEVIAKTAERLGSAKKTAILLGGHGMLERSLIAAGRVAEETGVTLLGETFPRRLQRGAGRIPIKRIPYFAEQAIEFLKDYEQIILFGSKQPVGFFAYPGLPSLLAPEDCEIFEAAGVDDDVEEALESLASILDANRERAAQKRAAPNVSGALLTPSTIGDVICRHLPANAIISDEAITCAADIFERTAGAEQHDWLAITGGSIGQGLPVSLGASIASPNRKVVALQADGSAMYTVQALWTMVREDCDCTVILLNNNSYAILNVELERLRTEEPNAKTLSMLDLGNPQIDWVSIAEGMGMTASRVVTASDFEEQFAAAMRTQGPRLLELMVNQ